MQYYLNAESVTEDGLTPATGYHNFYNLIEAKGALTDSDLVDVVFTTSPIEEPMNEPGIFISGTIRPEDMLKYPVFYTANQILNGEPVYYIRSNTSFSHFEFRRRGYELCFTKIQGATNIAIVSSIFDNVVVPQYTAEKY